MSFNEYKSSPHVLIATFDSEMVLTKIVLILIVNSLCYNVIESQFGRDWALWTKARRIINLEISNKKAIGLHPLNELKNFDVYTYGFDVLVTPPYARFYQKDTINIIQGSGFILRPDPTGKIVIQVAMPLREVNTCGLVIGSPKTDTSEFISNISLYWNTEFNNNYKEIARPDNGQLFYNLNFQNGEVNRALFFDSLPIKFMKFVIYPRSQNPIKLTFASINKCVYAGRHIITDCGEKLQRNKKFDSQPYGVPISIKCPLDCYRTWPCWGYKIYSADSPICWTALQNFGRKGNGFYTIYKIEKVFYFRNQINPLLTNGVYCRPSVTKYKAFTFERKYYDFAVEESKQLS